MKIHFIAIGGSIMHNLAIKLKEAGHRVTGSDDAIREPSLSRLAAHGLLPNNEGWSTSRILPELDAVILGMHAREDNPELEYARELDLPIYSFPEFMYQQTKGKKRVVIAGSHGKTTITAMVLHVLKHAGHKVDYLLDSSPEGHESMVELSDDADVAVFEGDEYLASPLDKRPKFLHYKPHVALISGIAWDHINVFRDEDVYAAQFEKFIASMARDGALIYFSEDKQLRDMVNRADEPAHKIGYSTPEYSVKDAVSILHTGPDDIPLQVFGRHNMQNIAGARQVCKNLGIGDKIIYDAIASFKGPSRCLSVVRENMHSAVFLDNAHAPSKVKAAVDAVKEHYPGRTLTACLELYTFSSLNGRFLGQYKQTMSMADEAMVYFNPDTIRQKRLPQLRVAEIKQAFGVDTEVFTSRMALEHRLLSKSWPHANLLLMSSGDFSGLDSSKLADKIIHQGDNS